MQRHHRNPTQRRVAGSRQRGTAWASAAGASDAPSANRGHRERPPNAENPERGSVYPPPRPREQWREARERWRGDNGAMDMPGGIADWFGRRGDTEDMVHGLPIIIFARWILVVAGLALALWNAQDLVELQVSVVLILLLAVGNFFLHTQLLRKEPIRVGIVYAASLADLAIVSAILIAVGQFPSTPYVFYLPALLAISVTFSTRVTFVYAVATLLAYGLIAVATGGASSGAAVLTHLLILTAVPVCGNVYWRMERDRRVTSTDVREALSGHTEESGADGGS